MHELRCAWQTAPIPGAWRGPAGICLSAVGGRRWALSSPAPVLFQLRLRFESAAGLTAQEESPYGLILGLLSAAGGVVDQPRSLYPDHSTTATALFRDMMNKRCSNSYRSCGGVPGPLQNIRADVTAADEEELPLQELASMLALCPPLREMQPHYSEAGRRQRRCSLQIIDAPTLPWSGGKRRG